MLGQPLFPGESGVDQLVEIIKVLGTPTREQIKNMNPNYTDYKFPQIKASAWSKVRFVARISSSGSMKANTFSTGVPQPLGDARFARVPAAPTRLHADVAFDRRRSHGPPLL